MTASPRASVVMTVFRDFRFFDEAVASVLAQDFPELELIIVDDGNDRDDLFAAVAARDPRIRILHCPRNIGTAAAANLGIAAARSGLIVRLDADDAAEPERVGRLVAEFERDPGLGLLGSAVQIVDEEQRRGPVVRMPETDLEIRWTILFHNPFYHSAAAFRRELFEAVGGYREEELVSQDHYLWFSLLPLCRAGNLPEPLTRYRINRQGLTVRNNTRPRNRTHAIREALWADLGLVYDLHDDTLAGAVSAFLRGQKVRPEMLAPAWEVVERMLAVFLASPRARADAAAIEDGRRLEARLRAQRAAAA
ncbi:glycosyltransferase [Rhodobacter sp. CZR27]|uniref:glycosyltransferase n=1 Tax=Rhodobacter sp. CZR27 TaxID=2033869 RepID=UPI0012FD6A89|nr:glycosyltransferase [Rhodobacter sp. CZR27]